MAPPRAAASVRGGVHVLMLPGPPHECCKMFRTGAIPLSAHALRRDHCLPSLRIYGQGESQIEAMLHDRIASMVNPSVAPYAKPDECMLRVTAKAKSEAEAEEMLRGAIEEVMPVIGEWVYGIDVGSLEEVVSVLLREGTDARRRGELHRRPYRQARMTDLPGASQVFMGGVVSYTNFVKANVLGVPQALLDEHGAVSEPVARAMAEASAPSPARTTASLSPESRGPTATSAATRSAPSTSVLPARTGRCAASAISANARASASAVRAPTPLSTCCAGSFKISKNDLSAARDGAK